jgi:uncharacterized protein
VLAEIERRTQRPAARLFDLMAGTSTGGIIVAALARPGEQDASLPALSAEAVARLYLDEGRRIFSRSALRRLRTLEGTLGARYPSRGLREVLDRHLGEARLRDTLVPLLVPAYETTLRSPFFFRTTRAREDAAWDWALREVALATAAAPTYFEPALVRNRHTAERWSLIDGGVYAVNPALCAWVDAHAAGGADLTVVSLGTGQATEPLPHRRIRGWGRLAWVRPLLDIVFDGSSGVVDHQLGQLLGAGAHQRLQPRLDEAREALDDASPGNLDALRREAERLIERESDRIDEICDRLTA